ncbi:MAG: 2-phosphosulfolactate phosphatase [candidate division WOR-3 bacterium]
MRVDVQPVVAQLTGLAEHGTVVVIDVFRATTTITTALANGARYVLPAADVEQALKLYEPYEESEAVLGGEREGVKIQGFHLGNSPAEYSPDRVRNRVIVFTSTNGSRTILACRDARKLYLGCFLNLSRVADELASDEEVTLVCAGDNGRLSLEDFICAGGIVARLARSAELSDSALAAKLSYQSVRTRLVKTLCVTAHGRELTRLGFRSDMEQALRLDAVSVLPRLTEGRIQL